MSTLRKFSLKQVNEIDGSDLLESKPLKHLMVLVTRKDVNDAIIETAKQGKEKEKKDSKRWKIGLIFSACLNIVLFLVAYFK